MEICRARRFNGGSRCLVHTDQARAAARAEAAQLRAGHKLCVWFGELTQVSSEGTGTPEAYSRWRLVLHKIMKSVTEAAQNLSAKREALKAVRAEHASRRLAAVRDAERRAKAAGAVAEVERLILEREAASDALQIARDDEVRARFHEDWPTPKEMAHDLLLDAISERSEWEFQLRKAEEKLRPVDDLPDPKTGQSTPAKEKWRYAKKKLDFSIRHEALMQERYERTPTHDEAVKDLAAAEARFKAAKKDLAGAKKIQEALLTTGRPLSAVAKVAA